MAGRQIELRHWSGSSCLSNVAVISKPVPVTVLPLTMARRVVVNCLEVSRVLLLASQGFGRSVTSIAANISDLTRMSRAPDKFASATDWLCAEVGLCLANHFVGQDDMRR